MLFLDFPDGKWVAVKHENIDWQIQILQSISRNHLYRKHISPILQDEVQLDRKAALCHLHNTAYATFVLQWCQLFGNDKDKSHWKKIRLAWPDKLRFKTLLSTDDFRTRVRQHILTESGADEHSMKSCRQAMLTARDKFFAHLHIGRIPQMPFVNVAYKISLAYSQLLTNLQTVELEPYYIYPISEQEEDRRDEIQTLF